MAKKYNKPAKQNKSKKMQVHVCVWETSGNYPAVFIARTLPRLYEIVWVTIKDYWDEEVGEGVEQPEDPSKAIDIYMEACNRNENGESFFFFLKDVE